MFQGVGVFQGAVRVSDCNERLGANIVRRLLKLKLRGTAQADWHAAEPTTLLVNHHNHHKYSCVLIHNYNSSQLNMAPTAAFTTQTAANSKAVAAKNGQNTASAASGVHLTSEDIIELEHKYGAHK